MQSLPVLAESFFPDIEGCDCQRNEKQECDQANDDIWFFKNGLNNETPCETVIKVDEDQDMDRGIHKCVQPKRAAAFDEFAPAKDIIERSACNAEDKQCNRVPSCALLQILDRVGGNVACDEVKQNMHEGRPSIDVHGNLERGVTFEEVFHDFNVGHSAVVSYYAFNNINSNPYPHTCEQLAQRIH